MTTQEQGVSTRELGKGSINKPGEVGSTIKKALYYRAVKAYDKHPNKWQSRCKRCRITSGVALNSASQAVYWLLRCFLLS